MSCAIFSMLVFSGFCRSGQMEVCKCYHLFIFVAQVLLLLYLFSQINRWALIYRVTRKGQRKVPKDLVGKKGHNQFIRDRYIFFLVKPIIIWNKANHGKNHCFSKELTLLVSLVSRMKLLILLKCLLIQLVHQGSYPQGLIYGNSQVTLLPFLFSLIKLC